MFQSTRQKITSRIVFSIYFVLLIWLVLFKFTVSFSDLPSIRYINWIPFYYEYETNTHLSEVIYNILAFIPLGIYIHVFRVDLKLLRKCLVVFLISFIFEAIQFVFAIGVSDVTDLIGNTLGGFIGIVLCIAMGKFMPKKFIAIINSLGLVAETVVIGFMLLLWLKNR